MDTNNNIVKEKFKFNHISCNGEIEQEILYRIGDKGDKIYNDLVICPHCGEMFLYSINLENKSIVQENK